MNYFLLNFICEGIVKKFLDEYTISKINIYKNNQNKWLPAILERIALTELPGNPYFIK